MKNTKHKDGIIQNFNNLDDTKEFDILKEFSKLTYDAPENLKEFRAFCNSYNANYMQYNTIYNYAKHKKIYEIINDAKRILENLEVYAPYNVNDNRLLEFIVDNQNNDKKLIKNSELFRYTEIIPADLLGTIRKYMNTCNPNEPVKQVKVHNFKSQDLKRDSGEGIAKS